MKLKSLFSSRSLPPAILALVVLALYSGSWGGPFLVDDKMHILSGGGGEGWSELKSLWQAPFFDLPQSEIAQYYRPLTRLTYKIERFFFGNNPFGYHLVNTLLHLLNGWLVYLLGRKLLGNDGAALVAALFFVAHPLQVEEVTYISGLGGLAAAAGMLASIHFYLGFQEKDAGRLYLFALLTFVAALLFKESALILPLLLFWLVGPADPAPVRLSRGKSQWPYLGGYFLCLLGYLLLRFFTPVKDNLFGGGWSIVWLSLLSSGSGLLLYLKLIFFPLHLHFYRSLELATRGWEVSPFLVIFAGAVVMTAVLARKRSAPPGMLAGAGWFVIGLLPVCGLKLLFLQRGYLFWAEHFLYLPLIGFGLAVAGLAGASPSKKKPAVKITIFSCGAAILIFYSLLTINQNRVWTDELHFSRRAARYEPHLFRTRELLGGAYFASGDAEGAIGEYEAARENLKRHSGCSSETDYGPFENHYLRIFLPKLACAYAAAGRLPEAVATSEEMIVFFPGQSEGYLLLGVIYLESGRARDALPRLKEAYRLNPRDFGTASSLIACYQKLGKFNEAKNVWREAARKIPAFQAALEELKGERKEEIKISRRILGRSLALGKSFLLNNQRPEGNFNYEYDFIDRTYSAGDRQVRQAGALWGLALIDRDDPSAETAGAVGRGLAFFDGHSVETDKLKYILYPGASTGKTGTVALVALTIMESLPAGPSGGKYGEDLEKYIDFLLSLRRDDGRFNGFYSLTDGKGSGGPSPYFDGETLLALTKAAKYHGFDNLKETVLDSAEKMYGEYVIEARRADPDGNLTKGFYQWGSMAFYELYTSGWEGTEKYADYTIDLAYWMIDVHRTLERRKNTGYAYEGLILAWELARLTGNGEALARIGAVIEPGLTKLTSWQVGGPLENEYLKAHPTDDPRAVGGVMNGKADPKLRIDVTQHQMHAVILARRFVYPRSFKDFSREDLRAAAELAGDYLLRAMDPRGKFDYIYRPLSDRTSKKYNILRHAGSVYSILEFYGLTGDEKLLEGAKRGLGYLLRASRPAGEETRCIVEKGYVKLGGNALAAITLAKYMEVTGDRESLPILLELGEWIRSFQAENGRFRIHKRKFPDGEVADFISDYYPGEAVLALVRIYGQDPDDKWLDAAGKAADYLIEVRDRGLSVSELPHDHWLLYGLNELYRYRPKQLYLNHVRKIKDAIIGSQNLGPENPDWYGSFSQPPGAAPAASRSEGLAAAYNLLQEFGEPGEADEILEAIRRAVAFQLQLQYRPENAIYLRNPERALGGFKKSLTDYSIRIDYVQHNLSSFLLLYRIMTTDAAESQGS